MASDTRKLVIEIVEKETKEVKKEKEESKTSLTKQLKPNETNESLQMAKNVLVNQVYPQIKNSLIQTVEFNLNRYFTIHEDYISENTYNNAKSAIGKMASFGTTVAAGAMMGGPVGAIVAAGAWVINQRQEEQATMSNYYQGLNSSNMETAFSRTRAGLINNSKGTEN